MNIHDSIRAFIHEYPDIQHDDVHTHIQDMYHDAINTNRHLEGKTMTDNNHELFETLGHDQTLYEKLQNEYRVIHTIDDLHRGKYIRWCRLVTHDDMTEHVELSPGGFVLRVQKKVIQNTTTDDTTDNTTDNTIDTTDNTIDTTDNTIDTTDNTIDTIYTTDDTIDTTNIIHTILCKNRKRYVQCIFEDTIVFQKLSFHEIMILEYRDAHTSL